MLSTFKRLFLPWLGYLRDRVSLQCRTDIGRRQCSHQHTRCRDLRYSGDARVGCVAHRNCVPGVQRDRCYRGRDVGLRYGSLSLSLLPAVLFFVAMLPHYPAIMERPVPVNYILELLDLRWLQLAFVIMLIGTFIETGSGMIHAVNERVAGALKAVGKDLSDRNRVVVAVCVLIIALLVSGFGMIELVAVGYGTLTWVYMLVFVLPLFTVGVWKVLGRGDSVSL